MIRFKSNAKLCIFQPVLLFYTVWVGFNAGGAWHHSPPWTLRCPGYLVSRHHSSLVHTFGVVINGTTWAAAQLGATRIAANPWFKRHNSPFKFTLTSMCEAHTLKIWTPKRGNLRSLFRIKSSSSNEVFYSKSHAWLTRANQKWILLTKRYLCNKQFP